MTHLQAVPITSQPLDRFRSLLDEAQFREAEEALAGACERMTGRVWWHVNSTARGGGVAEMLPSLLAYARGAGVDARWLVIGGTPDFFRITKRLHHALHGSLGDGEPLGEPARAIYEAVLRASAAELLALVGVGDVVFLHDPQTAGLAPALVRQGAIVVWQCHVGDDETNEEVARGWAFLAPYLAGVAATIFTRATYIPPQLAGEQSVVIPPSIDPFSPKNQGMDDSAVRAILVHTGLVEGPPGPGAPIFQRADGTPGRVDRCADILRLGRAPTWETPLVVQVSRWDPLKDPLGVLRGFAELVDGTAPAAAELVLAGPNVSAVSDDPEGAAVYEAVVTAWRQLPHAVRNRVHLASLPLTDVEENAAIVNALQRHAAVVVQKSLHEGFGLTVTEAMWKARPVVAGAVGGIQDQIVDGVHGLLVQDPTDLDAFAGALRRLLEDSAYAARLGEAARRRVRQEYLTIRHLVRYVTLLERIDHSAHVAAP